MSTSETKLKHFRVQLQELIDSSKEFMDSEEYKKIEALMLLAPDVKGLIDIGKAIGSYELAQKLENSFNQAEQIKSNDNL